jgi:DNA-binding XRE family transcriptional regulator
MSRSVRQKPATPSITMTNGGGALGSVAMVAPADPQRSSQSTKLARLRVRADLTQAELARLTGIGERTYRKLEQGGITNPPIGYFVNCARVLRQPLYAVIEDQWLEWHQLKDHLPRPPTDAQARYLKRGEIPPH